MRWGHVLGSSGTPKVPRTAPKASRGRSQARLEPICLSRPLPPSPPSPFPSFSSSLLLSPPPPPYPLLPLPGPPSAPSRAPPLALPRKTGKER
jgi:hypothetical protein